MACSRYWWMDKDILTIFLELYIEKLSDMEFDKPIYWVYIVKLVKQHYISMKENELWR